MKRKGTKKKSITKKAGKAVTAQLHKYQRAIDHKRQREKGEKARDHKQRLERGGPTHGPRQRGESS